MGYSLRAPRRWLSCALLTTGLGLGLVVSGYSSEPITVPTASASPTAKTGLPLRGTRIDKDIQLVQDKPEPKPAGTDQVPPPAATAQQPTGFGDVAPPTAPSAPTGGFGGVAPPSLPGASEERRAATQAPGSTGATGGANSTILAASDAGDLLGRSQSTVGVGTQKRSPIANEPRIRGYRLGEIQTQADGAYWFPARQDLDTFLSKIDSGIIRDAIVFKGPYAARYGPGFSFIDIETADPVRYKDGFNWEGKTQMTYKFNGEQFSGRQTIFAGAEHWGTRLAYGHRIGNDYESGNGTLIPSSYNSADFDFVFGADLNPDSKIEFGYLRLDQTNIEFPGQIFDTTYLVTDGYRVRIDVKDQCWFDTLVMETWYNRTRLNGTAQRDGKRRQIPQLELLQFVGESNMDLTSLGYRIMGSWGKADEGQLTVGTDLRWLYGGLNESDQFANFPCPLVFGIPRSDVAAIGGLFVEEILPLCCNQLVLKAGLRGDYVVTDVTSELGDPNCPQPPIALDLGSANLEREFGLWLAYLTAEYKLTPEVTLLAGVGHAERPPTLTELYAVQPFLAILQQGFTTVLGNPQLDPERLWQFDLGVRADCKWFRAGASGFVAVINDYITYEALGLTQGPIVFAGTGFNDSLSVRFTNTDLATLAGGELYAEMDVTEWLTPFTTFSYVEGRDHTRNMRGAVVFDDNGDELPGVGALGANKEPLAGIPPMELHLGLRLHEAAQSPRYGLEFTARIVDDQERVASSLLERPSDSFTIYDVRGYFQASTGLLLIAGIENIFDRNYREHLDLRTGQPLGPGVLQPGRNVYLGMELKY